MSVRSLLLFWRQADGLHDLLFIFSIHFPTLFSDAAASVVVVHRHFSQDFQERGDFELGVLLGGFNPEK